MRTLGYRPYTGSGTPRTNYDFFENFQLAYVNLSAMLIFVVPRPGVGSNPAVGIQTFYFIWIFLLYLVVNVRIISSN